MTQAEQNKAIVQRIYEEAFNQGNWQTAEELMLQDYVNHNRLPGTEPGIPGLRQALASLREAFSDLRFNIHEMAAEDDVVGLRATMTGTHRGPFMGIAPTGRQISVTALAFIRLRDGRVVERWGVQDTAALANQLTKAE